MDFDAVPEQRYTTRSTVTCFAGVPRRGVPASPYLLDLQAAGGKGTEQFLLRVGQVEPRQPIRSLQNDHLTAVDRRYVGPASVVSSVNASPAPSGIGRHRPAKQNQPSPALVNFHFDFGGLAPVNSKKCEAGIRHRPFGKRSEN